MIQADNTLSLRVQHRILWSAYREQGWLCWGIRSFGSDQCFLACLPSLPDLLW